MTNIIFLSPHDSPAAIATDAEQQNSNEFNLQNIFYCGEAENGMLIISHHHNHESSHVSHQSCSVQNYAIRSTYVILFTFTWPERTFFSLCDQVATAYARLPLCNRYVNGSAKCVSILFYWFGWVGLDG